MRPTKVSEPCQCRGAGPVERVGSGRGGQGLTRRVVKMSMALFLGRELVCHEAVSEVTSDTAVPSRVGEPMNTVSVVVSLSDTERQGHHHQHPHLGYKKTDPEPGRQSRRRAWS